MRKEIYLSPENAHLLGRLSISHHRRSAFPALTSLETCLGLKSATERRSVDPTAISQSGKGAGVQAIHGPLGWSDYRFLPVTAMTPIASRLTAVHLLTDSPRLAQRCDCQVVTRGLRDPPPKVVRFQMSDQTEYCNTAMECGGSSRCGLSGPHGTTWGTTRAGWATSL